MCNWLASGWEDAVYPFTVAKCPLLPPILTRTRTSGRATEAWRIRAGWVEVPQFGAVEEEEPGTEVFMERDAGRGAARSWADCDGGGPAATTADTIGATTATKAQAQAGLPPALRGAAGVLEQPTVLDGVAAVCPRLPRAVVASF